MSASRLTYLPSCVCRLMTTLLLSLSLVLPSWAADYERAAALLDEAEEHIATGESAMAIVDCEDALLLIPRDSDWMVGDAYSILCVAYVRMGDFENGLQYAKLCLELDEASGDKECLSSSLNNIAGIYISYEQPEAAIDYLERAIALEREMIADGEDRYRQLAIRLGLMGEAYLKQEHYTDAERVTLEALEIERAAGRTDKLAIRQSQLAAIYLRAGRTSEAIRLLEEADPVLRETGNRNSLVINLLELGSAYLRQGNRPNALNCFLEAEQLCIEMDKKPALVRAYDALYQYWKNVDNAKALHYLELYTTNFADLHEEAVEQQISDFEVRYNVQQKQIEIEQHKAQLARQQSIIVLIVVFLVLLIVAAFFLIRYGRLQRRLALQQQQINETKDRFLSIISHDLKNPALAQQHSLHLLLDYFDQLSPTDLRQQIAALADSSDVEVRLLLDLLDWARLQTGKMEYNPLRLDVSALLTEVMKQAEAQAAKKGITITIDCPADLVLVSDRVMLSTALRNLLQNAVKFTRPGKAVRLIGAARPDGHIALSVEDEGIGMNAEQQSTLFSLNNPNRRVGTEGEATNGLGMHIVKLLTEKCGGTISLLSEPDKGTCITIVI